MTRLFKRIPKGGGTVKVDELPVRSLPPKAEVAEMRWSDFVPPFVVGAIMAVQSYAAFRTWGSPTQVRSPLMRSWGRFLREVMRASPRRP